MRRTTLGGVLIVAGLVGCDANVTGDGSGGGEAPPAAPQPVAGEQSGEGEGFSLQIPGLGVDVQGKDGNWDVKAPGTDVRYQDGEVDVKAPGADVRVK